MRRLLCRICFILLEEVGDSSPIEVEPANQHRLGNPLLYRVVNRVLVFGVEHLVLEGLTQPAEHVLNIILIDVLGRVHAAEQHGPCINREGLRIEGRPDRHGITPSVQVHRSAPKRFSVMHLWHGRERTPLTCSTFLACSSFFTS